MSDDELLAIYGSIRKLAESMSAREAALDQRTAALNTAIAQLEKMPFALGKQTNQYIGMGVREAIQQDFDTPIKESFKAPIADLERATREARSVMTEVSKATRFHAVSWWGSSWVWESCSKRSAISSWRYASPTTSRPVQHHSAADRAGSISPRRKAYI